jgi:hypothetical protein
MYIETADPCNCMGGLYAFIALFLAMAGLLLVCEYGQYVPPGKKRRSFLGSF